MVKKSRGGFTLAEVLTTLMVIGVVAAMTIPTLLNSTNDQQLKVSYKKGISIVGQALQIILAKEEQCDVYDDNTLAKCMQKGIAGTLYKVKDKDGDSILEVSDTGNVIVTADGMAYAFYYKKNAKGGEGVGKDDDVNKGVKRDMDAICGRTETLFKAEEKYYDGSEASCIAVIDMNGPGKGSHGFNKDFTAGKKLVENDITGSDQLPLMMSGSSVRPLYIKSGKDKDDVEHDYTTLNRGYTWIYGEDSTPFASEEEKK